MTTVTTAVTTQSPLMIGSGPIFRLYNDIAAFGASSNQFCVQQRGRQSDQV